MRFPAKSITLSSDSKTFTLVFENVPVGVYNLFVHIADNGFFNWNVANGFTVKYPTGLSASAELTTSFAGGREVTLTGNGFDAATEVYVCGIKSTVTNSAFGSLKFEIPPLVSKEVAD